MATITNNEDLNVGEIGISNAVCDPGVAGGGAAQAAFNRQAAKNDQATRRAIEQIINIINEIKDNITNINTDLIEVYNLVVPGTTQQVVTNVFQDGLDLKQTKKTVTVLASASEVTSVFDTGVLCDS